MNELKRRNFNKISFNKELRPQDNFYKFVNRKWLKENDIPKDRSIHNAFTELKDKTEIAIRKIIEESLFSSKNINSSTSFTPYIYKLYKSFMNKKYLSKLKEQPILPYLKSLFKINSKRDFIGFMSKISTFGIDSLFDIYISNDEYKPTKMILHIWQSGLGLPNKSYYNENNFQSILSKYKNYIKNILNSNCYIFLKKNINYSNIAKKIILLEKEISKFHLDEVTLRIPEKNYNSLYYKEFSNIFKYGYEFLNKIGISTDKNKKIIIGQLDFVTGVNQLIDNVDLYVWKYWLSIKIVTWAAPYMNDKYVKLHFDFYESVLHGTKINKPRWKRGMQFVDNMIGEEIGKRYVKQYFPESSKKKVEKIVLNLFKAYKESITNNKWMNNKTKTSALNKLKKFKYKIGYPDKWIDYSELRNLIHEDNLLENLKHCILFEHKRQIKKLKYNDNLPNHLDTWLMTPQTINAYYHPTKNEIVFPAAILQPPFFDKNVDDTFNYGGIGAIIGHEIGHGFDDQGSKFDGNGKLRNWWSNTDYNKFTLITKPLVKQYENYEICFKNLNHKLNGKLTLGENIGDLAGLSLAYKAYIISLKKNHKIDSFKIINKLPNFFYAWAQCWRELVREKYYISRLTLDPHAPGEMRCNIVVMNMKEFHDLFKTSKKDKMWLDPNKRVKIW